MGPKITVDSATLANKGLELIEAHWLFGLPYDAIEVVVHPTSIVHSLVRFRDGALLAHLGPPGHARPDLLRADVPRRARRRPCRSSRSKGSTLAFEAVDDHAFPLLGLARAAGERGGTAPCAYNAANEVAVAAFLEGRLAFARHRIRGRGDARCASTARPRATSTSSSRPTTRRGGSPRRGLQPA